MTSQSPQGLRGGQEGDCVTTGLCYSQSCLHNKCFMKPQQKVPELQTSEHGPRQVKCPRQVTHLCQLGTNESHTGRWKPDLRNASTRRCYGPVCGALSSCQLRQEGSAHAGTYHPEADTGKAAKQRCSSHSQVACCGCFSPATETNKSRQGALRPASCPAFLVPAT